MGINNSDNHGRESSWHEDNDHTRSPLWMVTQQPDLNQLVVYLAKAKEQILAYPKETFPMAFRRSQIEQVRAEFASMIRQGEERLHKLCELLCVRLLPHVHLHSVVIGEVASTRERFTLSKPILPEELYSTIDLDLGNRQLAKLRFYDGERWVAAGLVANVVEYQGSELGPLGVHKLVSRIKAEEEIWNKVVDEIFNLDSLVKRDKKLQHLSRYVKDVFGIKIVTSSIGEIRGVQQSLEGLEWGYEELARFGVRFSPETARLNFLEVKDYLGVQDRKQSGWEALKSVVEWNERVFEFQIQSLGKYMREREALTRESHSGFKSKRESLRDQVAETLPLFRFFRDLLRWLFLRPDDPAPQYDGVSVALTE